MVSSCYFRLQHLSQASWADYFEGTSHDAVLVFFSMAALLLLWWTSPVNIIILFHRFESSGMTDPPNMCCSVSMTAVEYSPPAALSAAVGRSEHEHIFKTASLCRSSHEQWEQRFYSTLRKLPGSWLCCSLITSKAILKTVKPSTVVICRTHQNV